MKEFEAPVIEVIHFSVHDILTASTAPTETLNGEEEGSGDEVDPWW